MTTVPTETADQGFFPLGTKSCARAAGGAVSSPSGTPLFRIPGGAPAEAGRLVKIPAKAIRLLLLPFPVLLSLAIPAGARAGDDRIGGAPPPTVCVQVDIAGQRAGHLECAAAQLQAAARLAQSQARASVEVFAPEAGSPDATVGVASLSGARLRLGAALGHSVEPQRPPRLPSAPRPGGRP